MNTSKRKEKMSNYDITTTDNHYKVYLAGKIGKNDWRHDVVPYLRSFGYGNDDKWLYEKWHYTETNIPCVDYVGPYFTGCDHGCAHGGNSHGFLSEPICGEDCPRDLVTRLCMDAIGRCDLFFAWLADDAPEEEDFSVTMARNGVPQSRHNTAYGTLAELGYAKALGNMSLPVPLTSTMTCGLLTTWPTSTLLLTIPSRA
jgi:hypothetical protein